MEKIIVYFDDAAYAQQQLAPMRGNDVPDTAAPTHWVLVACAPRMTRHIGKFVSYSARENWRGKWAEKVFALLTPQLRGAGDSVTTVLAKGPLPELTRRLIAEHGAARVLDARRPKFGQDLAPVMAQQPGREHARWEVPGAVLGLGTLLVLAAE